MNTQLKYIYYSLLSLFLLLGCEKGVVPDTEDTVLKEGVGHIRFNFTRAALSESESSPLEGKRIAMWVFSSDKKLMHYYDNILDEKGKSIVIPLKMIGNSYSGTNLPAMSHLSYQFFFIMGDDAYINAFKGIETQSDFEAKSVDVSSLDEDTKSGIYVGKCAMGYDEFKKFQGIGTEKHPWEVGLSKNTSEQPQTISLYSPFVRLTVELSNLTEDDLKQLKSSAVSELKLVGYEKTSSPFKTFLQNQKNSTNVKTIENSEASMDILQLTPTKDEDTKKLIYSMFVPETLFKSDSEKKVQLRLNGVLHDLKYPDSKRKLKEMKFENYNNYSENSLFAHLNYRIEINVSQPNITLKYEVNDWEFGGDYINNSLNSVFIIMNDVYSKYDIKNNTIKINKEKYINDRLLLSCQIDNAYYKQWFRASLSNNLDFELVVDPKQTVQKYEKLVAQHTYMGHFNNEGKGVVAYFAIKCNRPLVPGKVWKTRLYFGFRNRLDNSSIMGLYLSNNRCYISKNYINIEYGE